MTTIFIVLQSIILIAFLIELILLHRNRIGFEELVLKFVDLCQGLYEKFENHNKKISENANNLSKSLQTAMSIKNEAKVLEGAVKDLQQVSKYIKVGAMKEFKDIEEAIRKLKIQLKQEK